MSVQLKTQAPQDPGLATILGIVDQAVGTFVAALPAMTHALRYKAFTIRKFEGEHADEQWKSFEDLIQAAVIQKLEPHRDLVQKYDMDMSSEILEDEYVIWIHARVKESSNAVELNDFLSG